MNRTERLHALTESLRRAGLRGRTAQQLADEFEVTTRTVKRDLAALEAGGLPVWGRTGPGGGYGLAESSSLPPVNFTAAQALALSAAVAVTAQAPFSELARTATRKVLDVLDPAARRRAAALSNRIWVDVGPSAPRRVMSVLEEGLIDQVTVNLTYTDARGRSTRREVEPMIFALTRGRWLLVAWCRLRDDIRWFDLSRIGDATATRRPCTGHAVSEIGTAPDQARPVGPDSAPRHPPAQLIDCGDGEQAPRLQHPATGDDPHPPAGSDQLDRVVDRHVHPAGRQQRAGGRPGREVGQRAEDAALGEAVVLGEFRVQRLDDLGLPRGDAAEREAELAGGRHGGQRVAHGRLEGGVGRLPAGHAGTLGVRTAGQRWNSAAS